MLFSALVNFLLGIYQITTEFFGAFGLSIRSYRSICCGSGRKPYLLASRGLKAE